MRVFDVDDPLDMADRLSAILVDGESIPACYYASEADGLAHCFRLNKAGKKYFSRNGEPAKVTYYGKVEIVHQQD